MSAGTASGSSCTNATASRRNTFVMGDVNGDGVGDFLIELSGQVALISSDFIL